MKHEFEFIIKSNEYLAENKIKSDIELLLSKYKHWNNIHEHGKQQNEWITHKFVLNLSQKFIIYYTWKNIGGRYKNNKLKIIAQTWNDKFELSNGFSSVSHIQDYIEYFITKHETLTIISPSYVYVNKLVFKRKDGYKLELKTPITMKLFVSTKK